MTRLCIRRFFIMPALKCRSVCKMKVILLWQCFRKRHFRWKILLFVSAGGEGPIDLGIQEPLIAIIELKREKSSTEEKIWPMVCDGLLSIVNWPCPYLIHSGLVLRFSSRENGIYTISIIQYNRTTNEELRNEPPLDVLTSNGWSSGPNPFSAQPLDWVWRRLATKGI